MAAAIGSKGHNLVFLALKNGNQGQLLMSIAVIFNKKYLIELKNHTCFNKACFKNSLKCNKMCYFAHFSLENSNSRAITHALTKTQAPVTIIIFSVAKMKLENKLCPHRRYGFQIIAP